jgi:hypothetical protein
MCSRNSAQQGTNNLALNIFDGRDRQRNINQATIVMAIRWNENCNGLAVVHRLAAGSGVSSVFGSFTRKFSQPLHEHCPVDQFKPGGNKRSDGRVGTAIAARCCCAASSRWCRTAICAATSHVLLSHGKVIMQSLPSSVLILSSAANPNPPRLPASPLARSDF